MCIQRTTQYEDNGIEGIPHTPPARIQIYIILCVHLIHDAFNKQSNKGEEVAPYTGSFLTTIFGIANYLQNSTSN